MTNPCNCGDSNLQTVLQIEQELPTECPALVHENVCVQAEITITPHVMVGEVKSFCSGNPIIGKCPGMTSPTGKCTFNVSQNICVQVPIKFSATAEAIPAGIVCGTPASGPCAGTTACTHTIGFFRNHPEITNALILSAPGDQIILGVANTGASFTVTTANAIDVLSLNTPTPPAPASPPFAGQYQILYAQLLAANLNVLSGATCPFATAAIEAANAFLAASPSGVGMAGAPAVQEPLAQFNEGTAPGCPFHCPE
ncbi:MAG: hypothetical protein K0R18_862 [Bacillales bacterium]|nr:hypothetical protein [Bacillales bacterium]